MRVREANGRSPVGYAELFFDLVFVFAVTQLSHYLLHHPTMLGALQTLILFLAVWWAWMFTAWTTNWVDPDRAAIRIMLACVMLGSLLLAAAMPHAFAQGGLVFAACYVAIQVGRTLYLISVMQQASATNARNMARIAIWFTVSAIPWLLGGMEADPVRRMLWWGGALTIEYIGPFAGFVVPGMGRSNTTEWNISGGHMAERCALFIIIALGEGIVVTGSAFSEIEPNTATTAAFIIAFIGSFAMWWVYFDVGAKRGAEHIEHHDDPGRVARNAFTYWHIPIVAGIIVTAVADALVLEHPLDPASSLFIIVTTIGTMMFLGGTMVFKKISSGNSWFPLSHMVGMAALFLLGLTAWFVRPASLIIAIIATVILMTVCLWEWVSLHGGWIERMEERGWAIGRSLRTFSDARIAKRQAREAARR